MRRMGEPVDGDTRNAGGHTRLGNRNGKASVQHRARLPAILYPGTSLHLKYRAVRCPQPRSRGWASAPGSCPSWCCFCLSSLNCPPVPLSCFVKLLRFALCPQLLRPHTRTRAHARFAQNRLNLPQPSRAAISGALCRPAYHLPTISTAPNREAMVSLAVWLPEFP